MPNPQIDQLVAMLSQAKPKRGIAPGFDADYLADENIDPSVRADAGNGAMQGELRNRLFQAERTQATPGAPSPNATSPFEVKALSRMLGGYQDEQAASPLAAQGADYDMRTADMRSAIDDGYQASGDGMSAVQSRNIHKRNLEIEKMRQPIQERSMIEANANARQGQQIGATQRMIETQMAPANRAEDRLSKFYESLASGDAPQDIKSISRTGVTFQNRPSDPSLMPLYRDLSTARNNLGAAGITDPWANFGAGTKEQQYYEQTANTILSRSKLDGESQALLHKWMMKPDLPFDQAFPMPDASDPGNAMAMQEWEEARRLAILFKGQL